MRCFPHDLATRWLKGVRSVCCGISAAPKVCTMGGKKNKKRGRGKGSGRESLGGEEGGETGKPSIRRTGCASQSEARSEAAAAEPGSQERGASPGLSEDQRGEREHRQSPLYDARKLSSFPPLRAKSAKVRLP